MKLQRYRNLAKSLAWEELVEIGNAQIETRKNLLFNLRVTDFESMAEQNFARGEIEGIRLFLTFPDLLIETAKESLNAPDEDEEV